MWSTVAGAVSPSDSPPVTVRKAAAAILDLMAAKPALAQLLVAEAVAVEPAVIGRYRKLLIPALENLWDGGGKARQSHTEPRLAFGQAQVLIFNQVIAGQAKNLPDLLPEIVYIALLPFAGHQQALRQAQLAVGNAEPSSKAQ
jgi:hypothetical protein